MPIRLPGGNASEGQLDYALAVAEAAAQEAAAVLRAECALRDGPRGSVGHCPADTAAEGLIRERLTTAFPDWGYRGEETRPHLPPRDGRHIWLVDPNDGTVAMQQGFRGHAVSIGLLRDGVPVLGVVLAPDAPDDGGDLFLWAEGCGPLRRNGTPVEREPWLDALGSADVVLVSQAADWYPAGNLAAVAPARFRDVPSIAYRLALVAAGEGVAAVSLNGPGDWDYAAGHALLRAVGGVLLDDRGREVTYDTADGSSGTGRCFGGAPEVVRALIGQPWHLVRGTPFGPAQPPPGYEPLRLRPGRLVHDAGLLGRAHGCLLGQIAGDALGSLVEFQGPGPIAVRYPDGPRLLEDGGTWDTIAGQPTDDSELALLLGRTIVREGGFQQEAVALAYGRWLHGWAHDLEPVPCGHGWCRPFDVGCTTSQALGAITPDGVRAGRAAAQAGAAANPESQANGALMRVSPIGVWGAGQPEDVVAEAARADARITHPHPVCQDASAVFAVAIARAIRSGADRRGTYEHALEWSREHHPEPAVLGALERAATEPPTDFLHQQGWVLTALQNAFHQLLRAPSLEEAVIRTVRAGGDTDTNAAICGALVGAVDGREAVPAQWRRMVLTCRPLTGHPGVRRPRPAMLWPADTLVLAERLLGL